MKIEDGEIADAGCALCYHQGRRGLPACEVHHKRGGTGAARRGTVRMGLCPHHHRLGADGLHVLGRKAFERHHGVTEDDLAAISAMLVRRNRGQRVTYREQLNG